MSVFNEIFSNEIEKKLYDSNAYLSHMKNMSEFLKGKTVHIPNYTTNATIDVNGDANAYDYTTTKTTEQDLTFNIDTYRVRPFSVQNFDELITNYPKFQTITEHVIGDLTDTVSNNILQKLTSGVDTTRRIPTTGSVGVDNGVDGSSDKKKISYKDILKLAKSMDEDNLPSEGRFLLVNPTMYFELLEDEAIRKAMDFGKETLPSGAVGSIAGISILKKNKIGLADTDGSIKPLGATADTDDSFVGLAWQKDVVMLAKSEPKIYTETGNAFKFGDIVSSEMYMGAKNPRTDKKGVYTIYQGA